MSSSSTTQPSFAASFAIESLQANKKNLQKWIQQILSIASISYPNLAKKIENKIEPSLSYAPPSINEMTGTKKDIRKYPLTNPDHFIDYDSDTEIQISDLNSTGELLYSMALKNFYSNINKLDTIEQKSIEFIASNISNELMSKIQSTDEYKQWINLNLDNDKAYRLFLIITKNGINNINMMDNILHLAETINAKQGNKTFNQYSNHLSIQADQIKLTFSPTAQEICDKTVISIDKLMIAVLIMGLNKKIPGIENEIDNYIKAGTTFESLRRKIQDKDDFHNKYNTNEEEISEQSANLGMSTTTSSKEKIKAKPKQPFCPWCEKNRNKKLSHKEEECRNKKFEELKSQAKSATDNNPPTVTVELSNEQLKVLEQCETNSESNVANMSNSTVIMSDEQFSKWFAAYNNNNKM